MNGGSSRRQFVKTVGLLAAAPSLTAQAAQPANSALNDVQALHEFVRARFGKFLNEEQLKRVRQRLELGLRSADALKKTPLDNSDEPDFTFSADTQG
jgi:hypothetical protein